MKCQNLDLSKTYPLSMTFSFPCLQTGLSKAVLKRWTKSFNCTDTVDHDIVVLLQNSINKRNVCYCFLFINRMRLTVTYSL